MEVQPTFFKRMQAAGVWIYEMLHKTLLGPALIGVLVFGLFLDFSIIEPDNTAWILRKGGDVAQNYLGSYALRADDWHFPITKTTLLLAPEGMSVVFTDSNPLLSVIAKCFRGVFPPEYQFFGIWFLLCWILQSIFAYLILKQLTGNKHYALLGTVFFNLLPTEYVRLGHANLVAFWTVLWAVYLLINHDSEQKKQGLFFLLMVLSALIHAYMLIMVFFIAGTWYVWIFVQKLYDRSYGYAFRFAGTQALFGAGAVVLLWIFGYFYNVGPIEGLNEFGYYSMNLNAPFNAMYREYSKFVNPLPAYDGQYEGYQYLGFGFIALLGFVAVSALRKDKLHRTQEGTIFFILCFMCLLLRQDEISLYQRVGIGLFFAVYGIIGYALWKGEKKELFLLFIPATIAFAYALSYKVCLGDQILLDRLPDSGSFYYFFFQSARSSGRFFWITTLVLLIVALYFLYRYSSHRAWLFLLLFTLVQYIDISVDHFIISSNDREYHTPLDEVSQNQVKASSSLVFINDFNMDIGAYALLQHKPLNKFYVARERSGVTKERLEKEQTDFQTGSFKKGVLYLFQSPWELALDKSFKVHSFYGGYLSVTHDTYQPSNPAVPVTHCSADSLRTLMAQLKNSPLAIIAVKDDASSRMPAFFSQHMDSVYHTSLSGLGIRHSYLAVFSYGKLVKELSSQEHALDFASEMLGHRLYVKSAGYDHGNDARIEIDGVDIAFNHTGMNVAILHADANSHESWNCYCFDTSGREYEF